MLALNERRMSPAVLRSRGAITQRHADNDRLCGMGDVVVASRKWNGNFHRRTVMAELGTDALGTWLWMCDGTVVETPSGSFQATPGLRLVPLGAMWSAYFVPAFPRRRRPKQLYVDITTPTTRRGNLIEFIDLDLDVEQLDDGPVRVLDEDEFTTHSRTWAYPLELVHAAEATCQMIVSVINSGEPPFDGSEIHWWPYEADDRVFDLPVEDRSGPSRGSTADDSG